MCLFKTVHRIHNARVLNIIDYFLFLFFGERAEKVVMQTRTNGNRVERQHSLEDRLVYDVGHLSRLSPLTIEGCGE